MLTILGICNTQHPLLEVYIIPGQVEDLCLSHSRVHREDDDGTDAVCPSGRPHVVDRLSTGETPPSRNMRGGRDGEDDVPRAGRQHPDGPGPASDALATAGRAVESQRAG